MSHCTSVASQSEVAEQQQLTAASAVHGSNSTNSPSWPLPPRTTSFFPQLFSEDDNSAVAVDAGDTAAVSSYVNELLLSPASAAVTVFDDAADHVFNHLSAFPMDSLLSNRASASGAEDGGLGDRTTVSGKPHTLEFVSPPFSNTSCVLDSGAESDSQLIEPLQKCGPQRVDDDEQQTNSHSVAAAKKAKLYQLAADQQCPSGMNADKRHLQSIINKVSQSQSVRSKEKLGERINALQQLVSPFGKTDTASVLSEAIGYIKFLQEQVQVLSSPYMKPCIAALTSTSGQDRGVEAASELRSRGLCLVPVSCTMTVANNNNFNIGADYWASTPNLSSTTGNGVNATRFSASG